jgi:hypothetical protein
MEADLLVVSLLFLQQLHVILGNFGCLIVERSGSDVWAFLLSHDILYHHRFVPFHISLLLLSLPSLPPPPKLKPFLPSWIFLARRKNIIVVKQLIYNDISSTKVRLFVRRAMSIKCVFALASSWTGACIGAVSRRESAADSFRSPCLLLQVPPPE